MKSTSLKSFLLLLILKSFVAMGNSHPITDLEIKDLSEDKNISKSVDDATDDSYTCVYIPSDLDFCNFIT